MTEHPGNDRPVTGRRRTRRPPTALPLRLLGVVAAGLLLLALVVAVTRDRNPVEVEGTPDRASAPAVDTGSHVRLEQRPA